MKRPFFSRPAGSQWLRLSREAWWVTGVVFCYALFFSWLACRKHDAMNSNCGDAACMIQELWHTVHGKIMYNAGAGMSSFGTHAKLLVLWVAPIYWLLPSAYVIFLAQSLSIGAAGIPFYFLARKVLDDQRAAGLMTAAFLFYPTVVTSHLDQIYTEVFGLPFLLAAAYFFFEQRIVLFLVFGLLGMLGQENLPLTISAFGVYALIRRRGIKWVVAPILIAIAYEIVAIKILMPYFAGGVPFYGTNSHFILGRTFDAFLKAAVTQPWQLIADLVDWDRAIYLVKMTQPLLWIVPLIVPEFILVLPALGMNLALDDSYRVIAWHYGPTTGAFLCVAALFGARKLAQILAARWKIVQPKILLGFCICALSIASWPFWLNLGDFFPLPYHSTLKKAVALASRGQSVIAPSTLIAQLAGREAPVLWTQFDQRTRQPNTWPTERMFTMDYAVLDANERRFPTELATRDLVMSFYTNTNYQLVLNENNVFVFEHKRMQAGSP